MSSPDDAASPTEGADFMRRFLPSSPFVDYLGMRLVEMQPDQATLALPFHASLVTIGTVVHGGAIAALIDTAAMAAAWSGAGARATKGSESAEAQPRQAPAAEGAALPEKLRGATVGLSISYLTAASGEDLEATGRVLQRGKTLVYVDVEVRGASGKLVAKGMVTYKLG